MVTVRQPVHEYPLVSRALHRGISAWNAFANVAAGTCAGAFSTIWGSNEARAPQVACLTCYCQGIHDAEARGVLPFNFFHATVAKAQCKPFLAFDAAGAGINAAIAVLLAAVNVVLGMVIRALTLFERHRSHTEEHASLCWKTTIAQFLNTSITPLVASAEIRWLAVVFGGIVFESGFPDFTTNWCAPRTACK